MDDERGRFGIDELADLGGVSRRTVRYYVQEGLLPAPLGVGRGRHYDQSHLDRLLRVKAAQQAGHCLDDIRTRSTHGVARFAPAPASPRPIPRSTWRRLDVAPGVQLHIAHDINMPAARRLDELVEWCRLHLSPITKGEE
ncbi:MAG: MerR family transcriptional regulator [Acidobacteriota bacterium]